MQSIQNMLQHKPKSYLPLVAKTFLLLPLYKLDQSEQNSRAKVPSVPINSPPSWLTRKLSEVYRQKASYWISENYLEEGARFLVKADRILSFKYIFGTPECSEEFLKSEIELRTNLASKLESWGRELSLNHLPGQSAQNRLYASISEASEYAGEMRLQAAERLFVLLPWTYAWTAAEKELLGALANFDKAINITTGHLNNSDGALERLVGRKKYLEEVLLEVSERLALGYAKAANLSEALKQYDIAIPIAEKRQDKTEFTELSFARRLIAAALDNIRSSSVGSLDSVC